VRREPVTVRHARRPLKAIASGLGRPPDPAAGRTAVVVGPPEVAWGGRAIRVSLFVLNQDAGIDEVIGAVLRSLAAESATRGEVGGAPPRRPHEGPPRREPTARPDEPAGSGADMEHGSLDDLTARELQVLDLVARGLDNSTIASQLGISDRTVRNHLNSVFSKLDVDYRPQAVVLAREAGLGRT